MKKYDYVIVGAGFTGLTTAFELSKKNYSVCVIEADNTIGGLAGTFEFNDGVVLEKFYHHWFNNDVYIPELVNELGLNDQIIYKPSKTGMFYNNQLWKLSTPLDLLRFKALSFIDRIRLGFLVLQVKLVKDWSKIEHLSIREWLEPLCGKKVYDLVWRPLVEAKFSLFSEDISAVWFWKKLVLRGGTRNSKGGEELAYFRGGFGKLAEALADAIRANGGDVLLNTKITDIQCQDDVILSIKSDDAEYVANKFLFTPAFPIIADIFKKHVSNEWIEKWNRVRYLGNLCLVLRLKNSLSDIYWTNVNEPGFPFVGIIEHTNFDSPEFYNNSHIAFLSRYLPTSDPLWVYSDKNYLDFAISHLKKMFPHFEEEMILDYKLWRSEYAQPVTEKNYSKYVPDERTPFKNALISTMAQIYPEDRGTNYAVREGKNISMKLVALSE